MFLLRFFIYNIILAIISFAVPGIAAYAQETVEYKFSCGRSGTLEVSPDADLWQWEVGEGSAKDLIVSVSTGVQFGKKGYDCTYARLTLNKPQTVTAVTVSASRMTNSMATIQVFVGDEPLGAPQPLDTHLGVATFAAALPVEGEVTLLFEQDLSGAVKNVTHAFTLVSAVVTSADDGNFHLGTAGYATCYRAEAYEMPSGLRGGVVVGASGEAGGLMIDWRYPSGAVVPAMTPLLINGARGSYPFISAVSGQMPPTDNLLRGGFTDALTAGEAGEECYFYRLEADTEHPANAIFAWGAADGKAFVSKGGRAYLALPRIDYTSSSIVTINNTLADIPTIKHVDRKTNPDIAYTLDGRKCTVGSRGRGVYISGRKKIIVR